MTPDDFRASEARRAEDRELADAFEATAERARGAARRLDELGFTPRTEALWTDPAPRTPEGRRLWDYLNNGAVQLGTVAAYRDIGQRICQIEAEAVAARNAELAEKVREELGLLSAFFVGLLIGQDRLKDIALAEIRRVQDAIIEEVASPNREPGAL